MIKPWIRKNCRWALLAGMKSNGGDNAMTRWVEERPDAIEWASRNPLVAVRTMKRFISLGSSVGHIEDVKSADELSSMVLRVILAADRPIQTQNGKTEKPKQFDVFTASLNLDPKQISKDLRPVLLAYFPRPGYVTVFPFSTSDLASRIRGDVIISRPDEYATLGLSKPGYIMSVSKDIPIESLGKKIGEARGDVLEKIKDGLGI